MSRKGGAVNAEAGGRWNVCTAVRHGGNMIPNRLLPQVDKEIPMDRGPECFCTVFFKFKYIKAFCVPVQRRSRAGFIPGLYEIFEKTFRFCSVGGSNI